MELRQVRYFLALAETRNFTRAAERCNVTQPTLTLSIKKLEDEMGGPMINRERGNTHLTQLGQMLLPFLQQVYDSSTAARRLAQEIANGARVPLNFGVSDVIDKAVLVEPLRDTAARAEGLELHVEGGSDVDLVRRLDEGALHFVLVDEAAVDHERQHFHPIYREGFSILMPSRDSLAERNGLSPADLAGRSWVTLVGSPAHAALAEAMCAVDPDWAPQHRALRAAEAQIVCQAGIGLTLAGAHEPVLAGLVTRPLDGPGASRTVGLAHARGRQISSTAQSFARLLRAISYD